MPLVVAPVQEKVGVLLTAIVTFPEQVVLSESVAVAVTVRLPVFTSSAVAVVVYPPLALLSLAGLTVPRLLGLLVKATEVMDLEAPTPFTVADTRVVPLFSSVVSLAITFTVQAAAFG